MRTQSRAVVDVCEQALEEVFRHTPVGVVLIDLHGSILDANVSFCAMLGRHRDDVVGQEVRAFVHPEEADAAQSSLGRLRTEEVSSLEELPQSMMPEGLLETLTTDQRRDLIAYLMHPSQVPMP